MMTNNSVSALLRSCICMHAWNGMTRAKVDSPIIKISPGKGNTKSEDGHVIFSFADGRVVLEIAARDDFRVWGRETTDTTAVYVALSLWVDLA